MRKSSVFRLIVAAFLLGGVVAYTQQGGPPASKLTTQKLADDLYVIHNDFVPGNTTALITNEGVVLVDDKFEIICDPSAYGEVAAALEAHQLTPDVSEITRIPTSTVDLDAETARKVLKLMERLDDHDDVQRVSANFNIPQEAMAEIEG